MLKKTREKFAKFLIITALFGLVAGPVTVTPTYASDCTGSSCSNGGG